VDGDGDVNEALFSGGIVAVAVAVNVNVHVNVNVEVNAGDNVHDVRGGDRAAATEPLASLLQRR
jgi:hypothetical protein